MNDAPPTFSIPRVATKRLLLREFRVSDFDDYADHLADPVATEHLSGVVDRRAAWRLFSAGMGFWMLHGAGWWAVELGEMGKAVGTVGAFFREKSDELELGWTVYRPYWGQGIASEAAAAALEHALAAHHKSHAIAHISDDNRASIRVSERIGMRFDRVVDFFGERTGRYVFER